MIENTFIPRFVAGPDWRLLPPEPIDVLVIGSGVAGLRAALAAAAWGDVLVVAKSRLTETNSEYAQGGVAAVLSEDDCFEDHEADTLAAGQGLADRHAVQFLVQEGARRVDELVQWGGKFDREGGRLLLAQEGGHSRRRILRAGGDATGHEIQALLTARVRSAPRIRLLEHTLAVDLLSRESRVCGALLLCPSGEYRVVWARATVLATGGGGQIYRESTNPSIATADGVAMAFRAGAVIRDMEFVQFHPTTFYVAGAVRRLISEAVRGEGGYLRDAAGQRFMPAYHPRAELAPRDVVSRSILAQIRKTGGTHVFLDLTHLHASEMRHRFPGLAALCAEYHIDIAREGIPVHPSAHYMIGGIRVDLSGRTSLAGLYACGEVASSGVHGANRLGSNSLLECLVWGAAAGEAASECGAPPDPRKPLDDLPVVSRPVPVRELVDAEDARQSLQSLMWRAVGIEREAESLSKALVQISHWSSYLLPYPFHDLRGIELKNLLASARLVVSGALKREESRGVHYRRDFPERDDERFAKHLSCRLTPEGVVSALE